MRDKTHIVSMQSCACFLGVFFFFPFSFSLAVFSIVMVVNNNHKVDISAFCAWRARLWELGCLFFFFFFFGSFFHIQE